MISYRIISKQLSPQERKAHKRRRLSPKEPDYKEKVFERVLRRNQLAIGQRVRVAGTARKGTVIKLVYDITQIQWEKNQPQFIQVAFDDGEHMLAGTFQLSTKKAK